MLPQAIAKFANDCALPTSTGRSLRAGRFADDAPDEMDLAVALSTWIGPKPAPDARGRPFRWAIRGDDHVTITLTSGAAAGAEASKSGRVSRFLTVHRTCYRG